MSLVILKYIGSAFGYKCILKHTNIVFTRVQGPDDENTEGLKMYQSNNI